MTKILFALLSGILMMFSFPTILFGWHAPNLGILGWVALVPLFVAIQGARVSRTFLLSFIAAFVWFGGSLYWIFRAVHVYGGIGSGLSIMVMLLLFVVLAAYVAVAPTLAQWIVNRWHGEMIVFMPVAWVAVEFARAHVPFGGFPWANIAMSQWAYLVPLQIVDLIGIYGLIFAMVWVNWCLAEMIVKLKGAAIRWAMPKAVMSVLILAAVMGYGVYRLNTLPAHLKAKAALSVGVVQGNIPQEEKWKGRYLRRNVNVYRDATKKLFESGADLIIWPEAAFTQHVSDTVKSADPRVFGLPRESLGKLPAIMIGTVLYGEGRTAYNSSLLFDGKGALLGRYDKSHLVPFGEYVPMRKLFFFARKLTAPVGDFQMGESLEPLAFPGGAVGPLICYEDIFPEISRALTLRGATLLANLTNDAWYGVSSAPYQHLALSVFRAVENRRFLIRSTNTGVSAIIDPSGEILMESPLFERSLLVGAVTPIATRSFYTENGDWFAGACVFYIAVGAFIALIMAIKRRLKREKA